MTLQVLNQYFCFRWLAKRLVLTVFGKNAHTPALFVHIQTKINRLTRKIKFATLVHGKSPFGWILWQRNYSRNSETCLSFLKSYGKDTACSRVIHSRVESGEILAQRPQVAQGGPKGKISKLS
jgi:hypothetical protein